MRVKLFFVLTTLFFINAVSIIAQVSGKVTDDKLSPLEGITVIITSAKDSVYIIGKVTDPNGSFEFDNLQSGAYIVQISGLGYKKCDINLTLSEGNRIEPIAVMMEEDSYSLSAVTVTAKQNTINVSPGKTTINIASSIIGSQGNALDALKTLPGVIIRDDGTVMLNGQTGANVMLDNKPTYLSGENLMNLLRSIPASSVNKIELITHPSSKYDAAGNSGMINIESRKVKIQGINLSVSSSAEKGRYMRGSENLSLNIRHRKLNVYFDYLYYWGKDLGHVISSRQYLDPITSTSSELKQGMEADRKMRYRSHSVRSGIDYDFSDRMTVSGYVSSNWLNHRKDELSVSEFYNNKPQSDSVLTTINVMDSHYKNITGGANMLYKWSEKGKWDAAFDYHFFDQGGDQLQRNVFQIQTNQPVRDTLTGSTTGDIKIYSLQTNLSYNLSDRHEISAGYKAAFINIDGKALYKNLIAGNWQEDEKFSSRSKYNENISAGYMQLDSKWSSVFSTEIGLRIENTNVKSRYGSGVSDSVLNKNYTNLFPNITVQYTPSKNNSFSFLYGRRIVRPNYRDLNPFIEINNRFLHDKGNMDLKPELIDNFELSWLSKRLFGINLFYTYKKNPIAKSYVVEESSRILVLPMNLSRNHAGGIRLGLNNLKPFKWWTIHINASLIYKQFHWMTSGALYRNALTTPMIHMSNQLSLPYGWSMEAIGYYNGSMAEGQAKIHPLWSVSAGLRKNLLDDKFSLYIYANDIFLSNRPYIDILGNFLEGWYKERTDSRAVGIRLTYKFNSGNGTKNTRGGNRMDESNWINM